MVGKLDAGGSWCGEVVYLYPGLRMALVGQYTGGHLRGGREAVLMGVAYDDYGLPVPQLQPVKGSRLLEYEQPGSIFPAKHCQVRCTEEGIVTPPAGAGPVGHAARVRGGQPGVRDGRGGALHQATHSQVAAHRITNLSSGALVCLFNGTRKRLYNMILRTRNPSMEEDLGSDYEISCDQAYNLDIPEKYISTKNYTATLAHKVGHCYCGTA